MAAAWPEPILVHFYERLYEESDVFELPRGRSQTFSVSIESFIKILTILDACLAGAESGQFL